MFVCLFVTMLGTGNDESNRIVLIEIPASHEMPSCPPRRGGTGHMWMATLRHLGSKTMYYFRFFLTLEGA